MERSVHTDRRQGMQKYVGEGFAPIRVKTAASPEYAVLHRAMVFLAGDDTDFAATRNDIGFNRFDSRRGHALAEKPFSSWNQEDVYIAWSLAQKYSRTQLAPAGIDITSVGKPEHPNTQAFDALGDEEERVREIARRGEPFARITMEGERFSFAWGGAIDMWHERVEAVRNIPGRRFDKATKTWSVPINIASVEAVEDLVSRSQAWPTPFYYDDQMPDAFASLAVQWEETIEASSAREGDLHVEGIREGMQLRPFQKAGVAYATRKGRCLIADEPGTGKSAQAIASLIYMNAFPAIIVCPSSLKSNWRREVNMWSQKTRHIQIASGTTGVVIDEDVEVLIVNYDILHAWKDAILERRWKGIVCDESHNIKTPKARRTKAVREIADGISPDIRLLLSGTPIMNRPVELWTQLEVLGYAADFGGYMSYTSEYCDGKDSMFGYDASGASNLEQLNNRLRSSGAMIRRLKADVLPELPAKQWATVPVEMTRSGARKYRTAEANLSSWLSTNRSMEHGRLDAWKAAGREEGLSGDDLKHYVERQRRLWSAGEEAKLQRSEQLIRFEALKQLAYDAKRDAAIRWIDDFLEGGDRKLVIFAWHVEVTEEMAKRYNAPKITGSASQAEVEAGKDRFMTDPDCRVIVCNIKAGGEGHTLTAASDVVFLEYGWNPAAMDQASDRCHRLGQRDSVTAWQLVAEHPDGMPTIDQEIVELIEEKRAIVNAGTDGLGSEEQINVIRELAARMEGHRK